MVSKLVVTLTMRPHLRAIGGAQAHIRGADGVDR
jgi:hypothetical protein